MSAIDVAARLQVVHTFAAIRDARPDAAIVIVSHDLGVVQHLADDVLVLHDGTVVEQGPTDRILQDPQHPYTRELVRAASW
jgi:peptide/nickel transport system ATP-binding protein